MTRTIQARRDHNGHLTLLGPAPECSLGGHEAEVTCYYTRTYRLGGEPVKVRVGFACTCGAVTIDGAYDGMSPGG